MKKVVLQGLEVQHFKKFLLVYWSLNPNYGYFEMLDFKSKELVSDFRIAGSLQFLYVNSPAVPHPFCDCFDDHVPCAFVP